jgi:hypothetical protein
MRKIQILGAAFFAVLAFGAIVAASASATDEWLVGGKLVGLAEKVNAVVEGTWLLLALGFGGASETHVVCSRKLIGTVNGLNASGIGTDLVELVEGLKTGEQDLIVCKALSGGICDTTKPVAVHADNLPWLTKLLLPRSGMTTPEDDFSEDGKGKPRFILLCTEVLGFHFEELCSGNVKTMELTNNATAGDVEGKILNELSESCKGGSGNVIHISGTGLIRTLSGQSLAVS